MQFEARYVFEIMYRVLRVYNFDPDYTVTELVEFLIFDFIKKELNIHVPQSERRIFLSIYAYRKWIEDVALNAIDAFTQRAAVHISYRIVRFPDRKDFTDRARRVYLKARVDHCNNPELCRLESKAFWTSVRHMALERIHERIKGEMK